MVCAFIVQVIHKIVRDLQEGSLKSVTLLSVCQSWVQPPSVQVIFVVKFLNRSLSFSVRYIDVQWNHARGNPPCLNCSGWRSFAKIFVIDHAQFYRYLFTADILVTKTARVTNSERSSLVRSASKHFEH